MAKVNGPLFSITASGRLESLVYDRRGYVRRYVPPTNPTTSQQGNVRQRLLAAQRAISATGAVTRADLKEVFTGLGLPAYRWNAYTLQAVIGSGGEAWDDAGNEFGGFDTTAQGEWDSEGETMGLTRVSVDYASDAPITPGRALHALALAVYGLGVHTSVGRPSASNAADWRAALQQ